ncbi:MAG: hypothetical protein U0K95_04085 [Eubacterium sp.]|nr:hypothetical protein [Eubacterium sp.]
MEMEIVEVALQIMITVTTVAMILVLAVGAVILVWEEKERRYKNAKKNRRLRKMSKRTAVQDVVAEEKSES